MLARFILDDNFALNVLSVFDEDNWTAPTDKDKVNIALISWFD